MSRPTFCEHNEYPWQCPRCIMIDQKKRYDLLENEYFAIRTNVRKLFLEKRYYQWLFWLMLSVHTIVMWFLI